MTATHAHGAGAVDAKSRESPSAPRLLWMTRKRRRSANWPRARREDLVEGHFQLTQGWYPPTVGGAAVRCGEVLGRRIRLPSQERGAKKVESIELTMPSMIVTGQTPEFGWGSPTASSSSSICPIISTPFAVGGPTGFSDLASAAKAQLGPLPGGIVLSATVGLGFPTGASRISGHAYNPYIQFPWSREIGGGWCVSGMFTQFWFPGQQKSNAISEATFVVEREVGRHADQIVEYVGDYPNHSGPSQVINYGGAYRFTATQQIDFHAGFGLTNQIANLFLRLGLFVSI